MVFELWETTDIDSAAIAMSFFPADTPQEQKDQVTGRHNQDTQAVKLLATFDVPSGSWVEANRQKNEFLSFEPYCPEPDWLEFVCDRCGAGFDVEGPCPCGGQYARPHRCTCSSAEDALCPVHQWTEWARKQNLEPYYLLRDGEEKP